MSKANVGALCLIVVIAAGVYGLSFARENMIAHAPLLAINFAHKDHTAQNCLECHHNFNDDTGSLPCVECHKTDQAVSHLIETQFHDYCRGCHVEKQLLGEDGGPVRECFACHQEDPFP